MDTSNNQSENLPEDVQLGADEEHIETIDNGRCFQLKLQVPQNFYGLINGAQGNTRKRLEEETKTTIVVPGKQDEDSNIRIEGTTKQDLIAAKVKIERIVKTNQARKQFTHFLSMFFALKDIKSNFLRFKEEVLKDSETPDEIMSLFQKPEKLHLTIIMLVLPNVLDVENALKCLEDCKQIIVEKFLKCGPLQVTMAGLDSMNSNPKACRVLYANIISDKMQEIADEVAMFFESRGIIEREKGSVKLHVTLMNTQFRVRNEKGTKKGEGSRNKFTKPKWTFDATRILEKFRDFHFGSFTVNEIHMSKFRDSKAPNGYYESAGVITF